MYSYLKLIASVISLELFRRFIVLLIVAFTGPLAEIPGPFLAKFTKLPFLVEVLLGRHIYTVPKWIKKYGEVVRIGPKEVVFADVAGVRKILVEADLKKGANYESIRMHRETPTLFTERDKTAYKHTRRLLSGGFSIAYLNGLEPLMQECIQVFEEFLNSKFAQESNRDQPTVVDVSLVLSNLTFDIMSATSFGGSMNMVSSNDITLKESITQYQARQATAAAFPLIKYLPFIPPGQSPRLVKLTEEIVATRRAEMAQKIEVKKDILQIILNAHEADPEGFTEQRVRDEMNVFMAAGTDTTSQSLTCTLLLLVNNPDKLQSLVAELDTAFPSKHDPITFANTQDLPYLNAVINESFRVFPIADAIGRETTETTVISKYTIPSETQVLVWLPGKTQDPNIWPDAAVFVPERWLGQYKGAEANRALLIPFSAGSRNCIGQQFALKEMRLILATLVRRFELSLVPGQSHRMYWRLIATFAQGYYNVGIKPRK